MRLQHTNRQGELFARTRPGQHGAHQAMVSQSTEREQAQAGQHTKAQASEFVRHRQNDHRSQAAQRLERGLQHVSKSK